MFNKFRLSSFLLALSLLVAPLGAWSAGGRTLTIVGTLKSFNEKTAVVMTEKGQALIPTSSMRKKGYRTGQMITAYVDIVAFARLNQNSAH